MLPMCENNHSRPFLVFIWPSGSRLTFPYGIGNILNYLIVGLHISQLVLINNLIDRNIHLRTLHQRLGGKGDGPYQYGDLYIYDLSDDGSVSVTKSRFGS